MQELNSAANPNPESEVEKLQELISESKIYSIALDAAKRIINDPKNGLLQPDRERALAYLDAAEESLKNMASDNTDPALQLLAARMNRFWSNISKALKVKSARF